MKKPITLSIITCTWNSEKYLQECIDSVKNQLLNIKIEHIFVDGLSTDKTIEIIQSYQEKCKDRIDIKILQSSPKGVYNAMNQGIDNATGDYLLFLNSDDYLEDDILGKYLEQVKLSKKDIYYGNLEFFTPEGQHFPTGRLHRLRLFLAKLGFHTLFYHPSCLIKRKRLLQIMDFGLELPNTTNLLNIFLILLLTLEFMMALFQPHEQTIIFLSKK